MIRRADPSSMARDVWQAFRRYALAPFALEDGECVVCAERDAKARRAIVARESTELPAAEIVGGGGGVATHRFGGRPI